MRRSPIRRTTDLARGRPLGAKTGGRRVGARSRQRVKAGGALALGRDAATLVAWRELRERLCRRAGWRCEVCRRPHALEPHHVTKRSQGGADTDDNVIALCSGCHVQTDRQYRLGRLVIVPRGGGRFLWRVVTAPDKWAAQQIVLDLRREAEGQ